LYADERDSQIRFLVAAELAMPVSRALECATLVGIRSPLHKAVLWPSPPFCIPTRPQTTRLGLISKILTDLIPVQRSAGTTSRSTGFEGLRNPAHAAARKRRRRSYRDAVHAAQPGTATENARKQTGQTITRKSARHWLSFGFSMLLIGMTSPWFGGRLARSAF
jgi:hypothetical protein